MTIGLFLTIAGTGIGIIGFMYQIMRNFKADIHKEFERYDKKFEIYEKRFEKAEKRFELIDQRLFLLCLGKDLPSILKSEREESERMY